MDLILWRHADAESGIPDEGRRLSVQGQRDAERVAAWLNARLPKERRVLVSPARRAQETARALAQTFEISAAVGTLATAAGVLEAAGWPEAEGTVVVVGHQPTLGQAASLALTGKAADLAIEKGAVWWLERPERERLARVRAVIAPGLL